MWQYLKKMQAQQKASLKENGLTQAIANQEQNRENKNQRYFCINKINYNKN